MAIVPSRTQRNRRSQISPIGAWKLERSGEGPGGVAKLDPGG